MSNYHAYADTLDHLNPAPVHGAIDALRRAVLSAVSAGRGAIERQSTRRHIARLSDHMLRDFGFERDWDGSIRSIREND